MGAKLFDTLRARFVQFVQQGMIQGMLMWRHRWRYLG
jgi:hypothetical protein